MSVVQNNFDKVYADFCRKDSTVASNKFDEFVNNMSSDQPPAAKVGQDSVA
jgi:hypothetical protein